MARKIQFRRGTAASWTSTDPTLAIGELGLETDTGKIKIGDGVTAWSARPYIDAAALAHIADTSAAHAAASIASTPAGTLAATDVQAALNELDTEKAPLASPALTGTPTAPTAATATNTTQVATTAFVQNVVIEGKVPSGYKAGQFYGIKGASSSTRSYANNRGFLAPMWIRGPVTFDRFCMEVTSAGGAGTVFRGGVWATGADGLPGALIYDVGASGSASSVLGNGLVDGTSATAQTVTINLAFTAPQLVWVGAVMQSGSGTPVIRALLGGGESGFIPDAASGSAMGIGNSVYYDSLSGALGSVVGATATYSQTAPALALRAA